MEVEPCLWVFHNPLDVEELVVNVFPVLRIVERRLVLHVERQPHVKPVEPHLVRVDFLVPEIPLLRARLVLHLVVEVFERLPVFFLFGD